MTDVRLGAKPSPPDALDYPFSMLTPVKPPMPAKIAPLPAPLNQGQTGTCVANAITGAASVLFYRKVGKWLFNEHSALDLYIMATGDASLEQGTYPRLVLKFAQKTGILGTDGKRYKIGPYHSLLPSTNPQFAIENAIGVLDLPVIVGMNWPEDWMGTGAPTLPDPPPGEPAAGGHCIFLWSYAMVGSPLRVDDNLQNSWGPTFGKGGRAYAGAAILTGRAFDLWTFSV
jgi:hypothetical protein